MIDIGGRQKGVDRTMYTEGVYGVEVYRVGLTGDEEETEEGGGGTGEGLGGTA